ncbi:MAG TPA: hypothetical protein VIF57_26835, partial [Polyangia bacterium]
MGFLLAGLAGCTGTVGGGASPGSGGSSGPGSGGSSSTGSAGNSSTGSGGNSSTGTGGSSTGSGGSTDTGTGGTGPACVGTCVCTPGIPATSQVPRMTRAQYDQVLSDLLGVTTLASASNGTPSS